MRANAEKDTRLAMAVTMRANGLSGTEIAARLGGSASNILNQTNRVRAEDLAHCCDREREEARATYWRLRE